MTKPPKDYDVGYRKPPKKSQFQKGRSGNPKGRTKGAENLLNLFTRLQNVTVSINENGKQKSITKREAVMTQLINKAASGSPQHMRIYFNLQIALQSKEPGNILPDYQLKKQDEEIIREMAKKFKQTTNGENNDS